MNAEALIFGGQALAGLLLITMAARSRREKEKGEGVSSKKQEARGVALEALSVAWMTAKRQGVSGYDRSLGFCALSECIARLRRGEDIDEGVAALALEKLGMWLEQDEDGAITVCVCEN